MSKIVKNIIALSVSSAISVSFIHNVNAATYKIIDKGEVSKLEYTYALKQNISGDMTISGTNLYNFPVQFQYLDEDDFDAIRVYALANHNNVHSLNDIEDVDALEAGNPTANDLAWVVRWLQNIKGRDIEYQKVGDTIAMTNVAGVSEDYNLWDVKFADNNGVAGELTRSTVDIVSGITNGGISYGTATASYLPSDVFTDSDGEEHTYWFREYGIRGFFSYDQGTQIHQIVPIETDLGGGESAILDVNEAGIAVGSSSYKVAQSFRELVEGEDDPDNTDEENKENTCSDPDNLEDDSLEACIARLHIQNPSSAYHTMAIKAILDPSVNPAVEQLGLLVTPHPDDERIHSSFALAVNTHGVAVGYADGWDDETEIEPSENEASNFQYAVVYKNEEVIDLTGDHSGKGSSRAFDINDAGIAIGHIIKTGNVQKFFYVDTTVAKEEIALVNPDDFFGGSDSTARAINNAGFIVGEGEIETHNESASNPRRTAAFVYDMSNDIFSNLNDFIPCSERLIYDVIQARGINDAGIISATAIVKADLRDAKGERLLDASGNPLREDVVRAISLEPMPEDGEVCTAEEEGKVERKGAGFGFGSLFALISLFGLRRKFMK